MRFSHVIAPAVVAISGLFGVSSASAAVTLFEDGLGSGWSNEWGQPQTTNTYNSSSAALMTGQPWGQNGQVVLKNTPGQVIGTNTILDFYVNTSDNAAATIALKINNLEYHPNNGGTYVVDGVSRQTNFITDADSTTWQHVTFDLTQPRYYWDNGFQSTNLTAADTITLIGWSQDNEFLIDSIKMTSGVEASVPEPTTLGVLGLAGIAALRRRRAM